MKFAVLRGNVIKFMLIPILSKGNQPHMIKRLTIALVAVFTAGLFPNIHRDAWAVKNKPQAVKSWELGVPIVTYWAGPPMTDAVAKQMAEGGWNMVWCKENELDAAKRHGLRAMLQDNLLDPSSLDDPDKRARLDDLIDRVKNHPALYSYYLRDEPNTSAFPSLGKLVEYLRQRDPARLAYINLFPTYATNEQLGARGDTAEAYRKHVRQYMSIIKPALISYDHYHFASPDRNDAEFQGTPPVIDGKDGWQYFLNLSLIRQAAQAANVPFLNIVQASSWHPSMRIPKSDEMRFLVYTTLAYGAQGISYYVYCAPKHLGGIANSDGTPTVLYQTLKTLNREFVAIASQLQSLRSLGIFHLGMMPVGGEPLPPNSVFTVDPPVAPMEYKPPEKMKGLILGFFGKPGLPTHVVVVNLDYTQKVSTTVVGPGQLEGFNPGSGRWETSRQGRRMPIQLQPGGGKLIRVKP
jgi:hypothetical protein